MKLKMVFVVVLSLLCFAGSALADDITVEFVGPWSFISLQDKIVAISPSNLFDHQPGVFEGKDKAVQLVEGVYTLTLTNPTAGTTSGFTPCKVVPIGSGSKDCFVIASTPRGVYSVITATSPKGIDRYSVTLPPGGVFELPAGVNYSEPAVVTNYFIDPSDFVSVSLEKPYAKDVKIHYTIDNANGTLLGTPDKKPWQSPGQIPGPFKFSVEPPKHANHFCDYHARLAFYDMNSLLQSGQFVDFPHYWGDCRDKWDRQKPTAVTPAFQELTPPDSRHISIQYITDLIDDIRKNASELLQERDPDLEKVLKTLKGIEEFVQNRPWKQPAAEAKKVTRPLNLLVGKLEKLSLDDKGKSNRALVKQEIDVLGALVAATSSPGTGANCKAPMMSLTVQ
jgi:hypothetical protein